MPLFNKLIVDSSESKTDLCLLGEKYGTDKSPYNTTSESNHRHPYTAVYDMMFASLRYNSINFGEMGILNNRSMMCWREYFPNAFLFGWDFDQNLINQAKSHKLPNTVYDYMNVYDTQNINAALTKSVVKYDVMIEDTTHQFDDQIRVALQIHKYLKPGGIFVIEDVFRNIPEERYVDALQPITKYYNNITFIMTEHVNKVSTGWDNDKLLVFYRNNI